VGFSSTEPGDADLVLKEEATRRQVRDYDSDDGHGISLLDILRVLVTVAVVSCGMSYYMTSAESLLWGYRPWFTRLPVVTRYLVCCYELRAISR
jgi:hypothetical protein